MDQSDSSFNNMTIKSADKHNSIVRSIPTSTKNGAKDIGSTILTPTSTGQMSANSNY